MGKGGKREVYDFLMSIDYGVCHGPVDSINEVWVKDKRIFCGSVTARKDVPIDLPDLFGGADGEGGCVGTVEVYTGTDDQVSSGALASRVGRTVARMPGYRGIAHLFFRGKGAHGFRWTSYNPYLPAAKVNVTRLPRSGLNESNRAIPPFSHFDGSGNPVGYATGFSDPYAPVLDPGGTIAPATGEPTFENTVTVNVADFFPLDRIDAGGSTAFLKWTARSEYRNNPELAGDDAPYVMLTEVMCYNAAGDFIHESDRPPGSPHQYSYGWAADGAGAGTLTCYVPPGTRTIQFKLASDADTFYNLEWFEYVTATYGIVLAPAQGGGSGCQATPIHENDLTGGSYSIPADAIGAVDAGNGYVTTSTLVEAEDNRNGDPVSGVANAIIRFYGGDGTQLTPPAGQNKVAQDLDTGYTWNATAWSVVPVGTRRIVIENEWVPTVPAITTTTSRSGSQNVTFFGGSGGTANGDGGVCGNPEAHCDLDGAGLARLPNANPAHVVYECLVNEEWGKGESPANVNVESFNAAAAIFRNELFGLSFLWNQKERIEDFIQRVCDHTNSVFYRHPATGQFHLVPLRDNYDSEADAAPVLDPTNCDLKNRKRRAWGDTVNEIVVEYTDPLTEDKASVVSHNLANISIQGGVVSDTRPYPGIRDPWLAQVVADREGRAAGYPLFAATAKVDRRMWNVLPGSWVKLTWPEDGITEMLCRVMSVDYGSRTDRTISLELVEDIFSVDQTAYSEPVGTQWVSDRQLPESLTAEFALTAPLPVLLRNGIALADLDAAYPSVGALLLGWSDTTRVIDVEAHTDVTKANGATVVEAVTTFPPTRSILTEAVLAPEAASTLPGTLIDTITLGSAEGGDLLMLGSSEAAHEIVMLDSYDAPTDTWTVARGIYDTVPGTWPVGTRLWVFPDGDLRADPVERAGGESITYRFLPRTSEQRLAYADAADVAYTATERPYLPFRPADVQLAGSGFGIYQPDGATPATVEATWVNRNRSVEDQVALRWDDDGVTPETGQTTTIRVYTDDGSLVNTITGLTGTSRTLDVATDLGGTLYGYVEVHAVREGLESLMGARRWFDLRGNGYGVNYGNYYGP